MLLNYYFVNIYIFLSISTYKNAPKSLSPPPIRKHPPTIHQAHKSLLELKFRDYISNHIKTCYSI